MLDRRSLIGCGFAVAAMPSLAKAVAGPSESTSFRDAIVINGNLVPPFDPGKRFSHSEAAQVKQSGLTALKLTLGGSDMDKASTVAQVERLHAEIALNDDLFLLVRSPPRYFESKALRQVGIILSFEGASMLEGGLEPIDAFRALDVLVMGLSYNRSTAFASGVMATDHTGLTSLGHEAVERMNARAVTIDISHSDELSSFAAIKASTQPVLITHAGCSAVHPHPRNKSDELIRALAHRGGVIGIYELSFLSDGTHQQDLNDYMAHMTHAIKVAGEDHVGIGTDGALTSFDTSPANMKDWYDDIARRKATGVNAPGEGPPPFVSELNRPDRMVIIADALSKRGYSQSTIDKVLGSNFQRVFKETWASGAF